MLKTWTTTLLLSLVLPAALAAHDTGTPQGLCDSEGTPALGIIPIGSGEAGSTTYYIDDRNLLLANGLWLYEETNQVDHLQRGGSSDVIPDTTDVCTDVGDWDPDRLIF